MAHLKIHQKALLARIRRIGGQVAAIEKALVHEDDDCSDVLSTIASCRGALTSLMNEVIEGHVRHHVLNPDGKSPPDQREAAEVLLTVLRSYLK